MYRKKLRKSQPPQKTSLESYELWVSEWTLLAQQAGPLTHLKPGSASRMQGTVTEGTRMSSKSSINIFSLNGAFCDWPAL